MSCRERQAASASFLPFFRATQLSIKQNAMKKRTGVWLCCLFICYLSVWGQPAYSVQDGWITSHNMGRYNLSLLYAGEPRLVWSIESDEGEKIQNQQGASAIYAWHPIGWMEFHKAGRHTLTVRLVEGKREGASLCGLQVKKVNY